MQSEEWPHNKKQEFSHKYYSHSDIRQLLIHMKILDSDLMYEVIQHKYEVLKTF